MNTFFISFQPSAAARNAAFLQGRVLPTTIEIKVNPESLAIQDRQILATIGTASIGQVIKMSHYENPDGEDLNAVLSFLKARAEKKAADAEADQARIEKDRIARLEAAKKYINGEQVYVDTNSPCTGDATLDEAVKTEYARRQKVKADEDAAKKAAHEKEVETFKNWALENGSNHLKDLIQFGFNWQKVAQSEWVDQNTPEGFFDVSTDGGYEESYEIKNPSPASIAALKEAIESGYNARLLRVKYEDGRHEDFVSIFLQVPLAKEEVSVEKFIEVYGEDD